MPHFTNVTSYETHRDIWASSFGRVIATYTVDKAYVTPVTLADGTTREILYEGQVVGLNPADNTVVPNYTAYGFAALGVLLQVADCNDADAESPIAVRGDIVEDYCIDNGTFGTVLSATKATLADRIWFVLENRL